MNPFAAQLYGIIIKYKQLVIGLIAGFVLFLVISLSAINVILFLLLGIFLETSVTFVAIYYSKSAKQSIPQAIKASKKLVQETVKEVSGKPHHGRPKGFIVSEETRRKLSLARAKQKQVQAT